MDRSRASLSLYANHPVVALLLALATLLPSSGCPMVLATGLYVWEGGNLVPAECNALEGQRVVVVCRPPASHEYRYAGASRSIAKRVSQLLVEKVEDIDVVDPQDVDNWGDESDLEDFRELAKSVHADKVVYIQLDDYELFKGKTLYQGRADVTVNVYDVKDKFRREWERPLGEVLYPTNSGIPAQDKSEERFGSEFIEVVAERIAVNFYRHDPHASFALDALANR